jgi:hypothetical protein
MRHRFVGPLLFSCALGPCPLPAQRVDSLTIGAQVRVGQLTLDRRSVTGRFRSRDSLSFVISTSDSAAALTSIPMRDISGVEVMVGLRTPGQAFRRGARTGALLGLGLSAVLMTVSVVTDVRNFNCGECLSGTRLAAVVSAAVIVTSTVAGGVSARRETERWQQVPFRP